MMVTKSTDSPSLINKLGVMTCYNKNYWERDITGNISQVLGDISNCERGLEYFIVIIG